MSRPCQTLLGAFGLQGIKGWGSHAVQGFKVYMGFEAQGKILRELHNLSSDWLRGKLGSGGSLKKGALCGIPCAKDYHNLKGPCTQ